MQLSLIKVRVDTLLAKATPPRAPQLRRSIVSAGGTSSPRVGDQEFDMKPGDTITIPTGVKHRANVAGDEPAVMAVSYSSPDRQIRHLEA